MIIENHTIPFPEHHVMIELLVVWERIPITDLIRPQSPEVSYSICIAGCALGKNKVTWRMVTSRDTIWKLKVVDAAEFPWRIPWICIGVRFIAIFIKWNKYLILDFEAIQS